MIENARVIENAIRKFATATRGKFASGRLALPSLTGSADAFLALSLALDSALQQLPCHALSPIKQALSPSKHYHSDQALPPSKDGMSPSPPNFLLAITPGLPDADRLTDDLRLLTNKIWGQAPKNISKKSLYSTRILEYPPLLDNDKTTLGTRLKTVAAIKAWSINPYPCIVVAPSVAIATPIPIGTVPPIVLSINMPNGRKFSELADTLTQNGYLRVPLVSAEGEFSIRGGIIDIWSPGEEFPVRAEFFGDGLESLRRFNASTQISIERLDYAELLPISNGCVGGKDGQFGLLADLLPQNSIILALEHNAYPTETLSAGSDKQSRFWVYTGDPAPCGVPTADLQTAPLPGFSELGSEEAHHPELFDAARQRLAQHLEAAKKRGASVLAIDDLTGGFSFGDLIVVTKSDRVFTKRKAPHRFAKGESIGKRLSDFDDLEPGEYVVHVDYGVGRFIGSSEILINDKRTEVFTIEYADGGKLHVPAAHAHLLSRYVGVKGEAVRMHRLDGKRWQKDKKDAQRAVADLASALLETQARRETVPGFAYDTSCDGLEAFEAAFPYEETPDQEKAISAVKADLAKTKPMDRLICGDAGYGKTEVAMRAAYIAAMNGKQVAVLAPTTVLAEQHFETFTSRFDGTPIRIESVSRFQSAGTHSGTFKRLMTGACDIVIGTHAILSRKTVFRDLGLIIIDEEQRFGVRHKEFLKRLRATADVLTLSATPIPRTLYLSMTGARDLSLLRSPPRERVAVDTKVVRDTDETIRSAIEAEVVRGGQVYFLHNRVSDISRVEKRIASLFPSSTAPRIVIAHGQMDSRTLARKMRDFERGDYDVLLSTTIIESGIDIPRANTILVDRADTFGIADLYQLRGRVGRSSRQGYAYFLLPPSGLLDAEARERLDALRRHGGLGGGFNLAVRDLELRGAGNLLGSQQSGHIAAVGFGLYCQLLQRTIALLKGEKAKDVVDVKLNLDFANPQIPFEYIEEDVLRINLMKRFAEAQDLRVVNALAEEMHDRFGAPPESARQFVRFAELRIKAAKAGISRIDVMNGRAVFYRFGSSEIAFVRNLKSTTPLAGLRNLISMIGESQS